MLRQWGLLDILSCHLQIETIWLPSFLFEYPLFFLSFLIALARTSPTILNRSGERGHASLVPDFKGNDSIFCPFNIILAVGSFYYFEIHSINTEFIEGFSHKGLLNFVKGLLCIN